MRYSEILVKKSSFYHTPLHSTPHLGGFPSEYRYPLWDGKTRMVSLPDGEKISKIGCTVWPQCTRVTTNQPTTNQRPTNQPTTNDVTTQPIILYYARWQHKNKKKNTAVKMKNTPNYSRKIKRKNNKIKSKSEYTSRASPNGPLNIYVANMPWRNMID